jgi:hypothetical protein
MHLVGSDTPAVPFSADSEFVVGLTAPAVVAVDFSLDSIPTKKIIYI